MAAELSRLLAVCGFRLSKEDVTKLIMDIDTDADSTLSFPEFLEAMARLQQQRKASHKARESLSKPQRTKYTQVFKDHDASGDGYIQLQELQGLLAACGFQTSPAEVEALVRDLDPAGRRCGPERLPRAQRVPGANHPQPRFQAPPRRAREVYAPEPPARGLDPRRGEEGGYNAKHYLEEGVRFPEIWPAVFASLEDFRRAGCTAAEMRQRALGLLEEMSQRARKPGVIRGAKAPPMPANWSHAYDVLHTSFRLLNLVEGECFLSQLEHFSLLTAALRRAARGGEGAAFTSFGLATRAGRGGRARAEATAGGLRSGCYRPLGYRDPATPEGRPSSTDGVDTHRSGARIASVPLPGGQVRRPQAGDRKRRRGGEEVIQEGRHGSRAHGLVGFAKLARGVSSTLPSGARKQKKSSRRSS